MSLQYKTYPPTSGESIIKAAEKFHCSNIWTEFTHKDISEICKTYILDINARSALYKELFMQIKNSLFESKSDADDWLVESIMEEIPMYKVHKFLESLNLSDEDKRFIETKTVESLLTFKDEYEWIDENGYRDKTIYLHDDFGYANQVSLDRKFETDKKLNIRNFFQKEIA